METLAEFINFGDYLFKIMDMTNKLNSLLIIFLSVLLVSITSCKDDEDGSGGDGDGGNGGNNPPEEVIDYLPRTAGNTWNYSTGDVATMVAPVQIEGREYWETTGFAPLAGLSVNLDFIENFTLENVYYREDNGVYYVRGELSVADILGAEGTAKPIEYAVLDQNAEVGEKWTGSLVYEYTYLVGGTPVTSPPITVPYTFEIMNKDMTLEVGGETFREVIHVNQKFDNLVGGLVSTDIYYANEIGIIRSDATGGTAPMDLDSYDLK